MTHYHFHRVGHLVKNYKYRVLAPNEKDPKGTGKVNIDEVCEPMNKKWIRNTKENETSNATDGDTSSNGLGETSTSN